MPLPDYCTMLDVPPGSDSETILSAYRAQCKKYHPDTGQPTASVEMMKLVNEAYAVLSDAARRREYDRLLPGVRARRARRVRRRQGDLNIDLGQGLSIPVVRVPAGEFQMGGWADGSCRGDRYDACHTARYGIYLPEFYIGVYPVTVEQYAEFVRCSKRPSTPWARRSHSYDPRELDDPETFARLDRNWQHPFGGSSGVAEKVGHPVSVVSWFDASAFCQWVAQTSGLPARLPTAAESQRAARGTDGRCYPWGERPDASPGRCNCLPVRAQTAREVHCDTTPVGSFSPHGDSPLGCADTLGNVWEWTSTRTCDRSGSFRLPEPYRSDDGREDLESRDLRLLMGGSFQTECTSVCCSASRDLDPMRARDTGFRICATT